MAKMLRGSFDAFHGRKAAHVLSAFAAEGKIILAHLAVDQKGNEIPPAQDMIATLGLPGRLFTLDAMHCQKKHLKWHATPENDVLVQLKANQSKLFEIVCTVAYSTNPADTVVSRDNGRFRAEDRTVEIFPAGQAMTATEWHSHVKTTIRVTRRTLLRSAATGLWAERGEIAFYVSSAADLPATAWAHPFADNGASKIATIMCAMCPSTDKSRIRDNSGIMARARSFALNIMRTNEITNVAKALWSGALSLDHILAYEGI